VRRSPRGFTLIELMVGSAVTFITVLAVTAAFLGYTQAFHVQAGIRGGQASLRQTHQMLVRNLRMAGYGIEPHLAFDIPRPQDWMRDELANNNSDRLIFRMRNPRFNARVGAASVDSITLLEALPEPLLRGQIVQVLCPGAVLWSYAQLRERAEKGATKLELEPGTGVFPRLNDFSASCYGGGGVHLYKVDVYDYSIAFLNEDGHGALSDKATQGRPYLFRRHGLEEEDINTLGEPVAEDIEALRVVFLRGNGTAFEPKLGQPPPLYSTPLNDPLRSNDHPGNIRAVRLGLVARSSTRDSSVGPTVLRDIPAFGGLGKVTGRAEGFRRLVSEMTVPVRNMNSSEMFVPVYSLGACGGQVPDDNFNCRGG
jgi:type IV pilus assembly protein PilW